MASGTRSARTRGVADDRPRNDVVLVLSSDPMAAALIGVLVETLGYLVRFFHANEDPDAAVRRERPAVALVDCHDASLMREELLGHARMRGVSVVIFGSAAAVERVRRLAKEHALDALVMPVALATLDATLRKAVSASG